MNLACFLDVALTRSSAETPLYIITYWTKTNKLFERFPGTWLYYYTEIICNMTRPQL